MPASSNFPDSSVGKESACNAGDPSSIPESGRSTAEGIGYPLQYSWASLVAQLVKNPPAMWETWVQSWVGKLPWRRTWQLTPVFLPGESHGHRSLAGYSSWDRKSQTQLSAFFLWLCKPIVQGNRAPVEKHFLLPPTLPTKTAGQSCRWDAVW